MLLTGLAACALVFGLGELYTITGLHLGAHPAALPIDARLPEASWSAFSAKCLAWQPRCLDARILTWIGLASLLTLMTLEHKRERNSNLILSGASAASAVEGPA